MCIARESLVNKERELKQKQQQQQFHRDELSTPNNWQQPQIRKTTLKPKHATRKFVSKAKINLNKYWHKFEEILTAAGEDIKSMSTSYHDFIASQKFKYYTVDRMSSPEMLSSTKLNLLAAVRNQTPNNLHDELNALVSKNADSDDDDDAATVAALKNLNDSGSSYKPFSGDELYYGVNLSTNVPTMGLYQAKRCSCYIDRELDGQMMPPRPRRPRPASVAVTTTMPAIQYQFTHRNIRLSLEDCQNLENEAMEVYKKFSYYDTSF